MFLLHTSSLAVESTSLSPRLAELSQRASELKSKFFYKVVKGGEKNHLAQRVGIEALGADLPTIACELVLRGYKSALGAGVRISLFIVNSLIIPTLIVPVLNFISARKFDLPKTFKNTFLNQFTDLIPEKNNETSNIAFVDSVRKLEADEAVKATFCNADDGTVNNNLVLQFKEKLLHAKSFVVRWDVQISGLLTYIVPWCQNWFEQMILGLIGFSGEDKFLQDSQKHESMDFHNRFKWLKFVAGIFPTVFGSHYFAKTIDESARSTDEEVKDTWIKKFVKTHLKQFDYYKGIFANKLNLAGYVFFGGDAGMLLASRTIGEFSERIIRLSAFWPCFIYGIEWLHSKFASWSDKKSGTRLIDESEPEELGIKKVKTLDKLEAEFDAAVKLGDETLAETAFKGMDNAVGAFGKAFLGNSAFLGVILNIISYIFMRLRISKGIY
ncbi:MAG: hypothetical protein A3B68_03670 [Candidatus Melainabacteria bacterium RIFCSPHIGHO2_02_FULL_34_12]|nr:MAG: hypothetical protein A3B68_03670 [Candidatus Melainabacteria bacterium RIFCSPHIGHO2_02_FULL_34_12]